MTKKGERRRGKGNFISVKEGEPESGSKGAMRSSVIGSKEKKRTRASLPITILSAYRGKGGEEMTTLSSTLDSCRKRGGGRPLSYTSLRGGGKKGGEYECWNGPHASKKKLVGVFLLIQRKRGRGRIQPGVLTGGWGKKGGKSGNPVISTILGEGGASASMLWSVLGGPWEGKGGRTAP